MCGWLSQLPLPTSQFHKHDASAQAADASVHARLQRKSLEQHLNLAVILGQRVGAPDQPGATLSKLLKWLVDLTGIKPVTSSMPWNESKHQNIDGKGLISRLSRQNRPNRRYLRQECDKLSSSGPPG